LYFVSVSSSVIMNTFRTKYGLVSLLQNEIYIGDSFRRGNYWDEDTLLKLKEYVNPKRNILEIGGHCGTSTILYASFLDEGSMVYVYEPQKVMFNLLVRNIQQNGLTAKVKPYNLGVFCYDGTAVMNGIDLDGGGGNVLKRYTEENNRACNFGGIGLGSNGEQVGVTTIDNMNIDNIGYIHCDAQGSENFIFSRGLNTLAKNRPVVYYEDNQKYGERLYNNVCRNYPQYANQSKFDVREFCMKELKYSRYIERFNGGIDCLLIP